MPFPRESEVEKVRAEILVNALTFLRLAASDLSSDSRTSVAIVHFAIGLELILKWRLAEEHWLLLIEDVNRESRKTPEKVWARFVKGDAFTLKASVLPDHVAAATKLSDSCRAAIKDCFKARNRVVHFRETDRGRQDAIAQQCKTWFLLRPFLSDWGLPSSDIESLETTMRQNRRYLQERFQECAPETSRIVAECPSCEFRSLHAGDSADVALQNAACWTCEFKTTLAIFSCGMAVEYSNGLEVDCNICEDAVHDGLELVDRVESKQKCGRHDDDFPWEVFCGECELECLIVETSKGESNAICPECDEGLVSYSSCGYCGQMTTGHDEDSIGCALCYESLREKFDRA